MARKAEETDREVAMGNAKMSPPWEIHARMIRELLRDDRAVDSVTYDDESKVIRVMVNGNDKADSLQRRLVSHLEFGNVKVDVQVIPANDEPDEAEDYRRAFEGNPLFAGVVGGTTPQGVEEDFALFAPTVIQFYSDDISSPFGLTTMTAEQLAERVLVQGDVRICSDTLE